MPNGTSKCLQAVVYKDETVKESCLTLHRESWRFASYFRTYT